MPTFWMQSPMTPWPKGATASGGGWMRKVIIDTDLFSERVKGKNLRVGQ
jgi:hypothetical protein